MRPKLNIKNRPTVGELDPFLRLHYHTLYECEKEIKNNGNLLRFMGDVTETPIFEDGSGGGWGVFGWKKPEGWDFGSSMGIGPVAWRTKKPELVIQYLETLHEWHPSI